MSWIGGDLAGLQRMGNTMKPAQDKMDPIVSELGCDVSRLCSHASWSGSAADSMRSLWSTSAMEVNAVATYISMVGDTIGKLCDDLQAVEAALYNTAVVYKGRGVPIDWSNGKPLPLTVQNLPPNSSPALIGLAVVEYTDAYNEAMNAAKGLRLAAASEIEGMTQPVVTGKGAEGLEGKEGKEAVEWDKVTAASILRGVYTANVTSDDKATDELRQERDRIGKEADDAVKQFEREKDDFVKNGGQRSAEEFENHLKTVESWGDKEGKFQALDAELQSKLGEVEGKNYLPGAKILNTSIGDLGKKTPVIGSVFEAERLGRFSKALIDIPVLDVAAGAYTAWDKTEKYLGKGDPLPVAVTKGTAPVVVGLGTGGLLLEAVPGAGQAVTAAMVGAYVVTDGLQNAVDEPWGADIRSHGVVAGVWHGALNVGSGVKTDTINMAKGIVEDSGFISNDPMKAGIWQSLGF